MIREFDCWDGLSDEPRYYRATLDDGDISSVEQSKSVFVIRNGNVQELEFLRVCMKNGHFLKIINISYDLFVRKWVHGI